MKTVKFFLIIAIISAIVTTGFIYVSLGLLNLVVFSLVPLFFVAMISGENEQKHIQTSTICDILTVLLIYSVMYSSWGWSSVGIVAVLVIYGFFQKPTTNISFIAAYLVGFEFATVSMEYYADHIYHMDNFWHDVAVGIFMLYALTWDIKKEVTHTV